MPLNATQLETLRAAMNRLIPADDFPGAWDAGCGDYLLRQLETGDLQHLVTAYQCGLDSLDAEAQSRLHLPFAALAPEQQDALLKRMEAGETPGVWPVAPANFLLMLANHTAEGYYSDPANGGNRNGLSWQMLGFQNK